MTLLPPQASRLERAVEASFGQLVEVPAPIRDQWNPATCAPELLPFLAFGVSIDFWDADWTEAEKRSAIAGAIDAQRRKGTPASLREVLDRFDPMIALVEWFEDKVHLAPYTFRLELPTRAESAVVYDEDLVLALLRDIEAVKPLRAHMFAVHRLAANADAWLVGGAKIAGFVRVEGYTDLTVPADPAWSNYLETQQGEPIRSAEGPFLEVA
ncbi:phage tail protein I [Qipengyuania citrea]|uniref:phage tail protein I n=1 Tax=Qipengyuania citrea TaxID=225971 RepID=UPI0020A20E56|nr:phage tail protein I [Qipengyuania citrea]MCP2016838.1 phage tail P2-like protein [Qipengyuania citrea]